MAEREFGTAAEAWDRARSGRPVAFVGTETVCLPGAWSPLIVRVRCSRGVEPLAPILEARRTIARLLGDAPDDPPAAQLPFELRRRLLGDTPFTAEGDAFVRACNRLQRESERGALLIFESANDADEATTQVLRRVLAHPGLALPLVLAFDRQPDAGPATLLFDQIRRAGGMVARVSAQKVAGDGSDSWRMLPSSVLRVLRTGVTLGPVFDARVVASLLDLGVIDVLENLQTAADAGVPVEDDGALEFRIVGPVADALRSSLLPSLARVRRGQALETAQAAPGNVGTSPAATEGDEPVPTAAPPAANEAQRQVVADVRRALSTARDAEEVGAFTEALGAVQRARTVLAGPTGIALDAAERRRLRIEVLAEMGRVQWMGAGPEYDFSLPSALDALVAARDLLEDGDPPELRANLATLVANVCYDLGDLRSLEIALAELDQAHASRSAMGHTRAAARLLNDMAAVHVRMGDPTQALALLERARKVFADAAERDPAAQLELAETDHLIARIPVHLAARGPVDEVTLRAARAAARHAEQAFQRFRATRPLARVWETQGRLELMAGEVEAAMGFLTKAARAQRTGGDALGLARTTAAMADALEAAGDRNEALAMLTDSVRLNRAKGSPLGLAFNRKALNAQAARVARQGDGQTRARLEALAAELAEAESELGAVDAPHP